MALRACLTFFIYACFPYPPYFRHGHHTRKAAVRSAEAAVKEAGEETANAIGAKEEEDDDDEDGSARPPPASPKQVLSSDDEYRLESAAKRARKAAGNSDQQVCET